MRLSDFWYEKLPLLYLIAALLCLLVFGTHGIFSALVLLACAGLTRWWRIGRYRLKIAADGTRSRRQRTQATRNTRTNEVKRSA